MHGRTALCTRGLHVPASPPRRGGADGVSGVAMPVFGPGGDVVAAIELAAADLARELPSMTAALAVASRSLSREPATQPRRIRAVGRRTLSVR
ncbi:MAG: hypothetical protein JNM77_19430 [Pseudonocardia sp.]|nr:hypothetical protein [Pseudonocardia sp.]